MPPTSFYYLKEKKKSFSTSLDDLAFVKCPFCHREINSLQALGEAGLAVRCFARTAAAISTPELCSPSPHLPVPAIFHPVCSANRSLILVFIAQEVNAGFAGVFTCEMLFNIKGVIPATDPCA